MRLEYLDHEYLVKSCLIKNQLALICNIDDYKKQQKLLSKVLYLIIDGRLAFNPLIFYTVGRMIF
jgi:hypothetical protein